MTGPQGMGVLSRPDVWIDYDLEILTKGPIFYLIPLGTIPTFTAWETLAEALAGDIALESNRGRTYFHDWAVNSNQLPRPYDTLVSASGTLTTFWQINPESTLSTYTAWESRATAYSSDIAIESQKGGVYFRDWFVSSGNGGNNDDISNDSQIGSIFKVEAVIT